MRKDATSVARSIQDGDIKPVYLLQGDDQYLQQLIVTKIEQAMFADKPSDKTLLLPDEMNGQEILERLFKTDLFSSKKLFVLRNPQQIHQSFRKEFMNYCTHPIATHCLVIIIEDYSSRNTFFTELKNKFDPVDMSSPFGSEIKKWIKYFFKENSTDVTPDIVNAVMDIAGDSLYHAANEVEKICISIEEDEKLTLDHVYRFAGWHRDRQRWELLVAIGNRDLDNAIQLGLSIVVHNETMLQLLYPLTALFQELLFEKMSSGTSEKKNGYIPLPPSVIRRIPAFAKLYTKQELQQALILLGRIDQSIKSTNTIDESELTQFLFSILPADD